MAIRYISFAENSGYGLAAQAYMRALMQRGATVRWFPLIATNHGYMPWDEVPEAGAWLAGLARGQTRHGWFGPEIQSTISRSDDVDTVVLHCVPEYWPLYIDSDKRNVGYTVWETDALPPHWATIVERVDQLLVPCRFNLPVFRDSGVSVPIDVVPHIRRSSTGDSSREELARFRSRYRIPEGHFVFYTIDVWNPRKSPWRTIYAFLEAFNSSDPVTLVVKTSPAGPRTGADLEDTSTDILVHEIVSAYRDAASVVLINEEVQQDDIDRLHQMADCYVSLTHCEGWGLGAFDAASRATPVIITGWGGQLDYLTSEWPYLIDFEMTSVMHAQGWRSYRPTQNWASPSREHAIQLMREVYQFPSRARNLAFDLANEIAQKFSEEVIGQQLVEVVAQR